MSQEPKDGGNRQTLEPIANCDRDKQSSRSISGGAARPKISSPNEFIAWLRERTDRLPLWQQIVICVMIVISPFPIFWIGGSFAGPEIRSRSQCSMHRIFAMLTGNARNDPCVLLGGRYATVPDTAAAPAAADDIETTSDEASDRNPQWLTGDWILAPHGGEDGRTVCQDLSASKLYRSNGNTGEVRSYRADQSYQSLLIYTTPSDARHQTFYKGRWAVDNGKLNLSDVSAQDLFRSEGGTSSVTIERDGDNVVLLSDGGKPQRFVRCSGGTGGLYGDQ